MPKETWIQRSKSKKIQMDEYHIEIEKKQTDPLEVNAKITKKDKKNTHYKVVFGSYKQWVFMSCTCPYFVKKIIPNAYKYGTRIELPDLHGIFVKKEELPIDKHCKLLVTYLRLI